MRKNIFIYEKYNDVFSYAQYRISFLKYIDVYYDCQVCPSVIDTFKERHTKSRYTT